MSPSCVLATTAVLALVGGLLLSVLAASGAGAMIGWLAVAGAYGVVLGLGGRRLLDRSTARSLARSGAGGGQGAAFQVSSYFRGGRGTSEVISLCPEADRFLRRYVIRDASRSAWLRLLNRLKLGRRVTVDDDAFNREIYASRRAAPGLFASRERRDAVRQIFRAGFFAIEYRNGLVGALRHGEVPPDVAVAIQPHLSVLARPTAEEAPAPLRPQDVAAARAAAPARAMQNSKQPGIPAHLLALDAVGCVLLGLGLAKQFREIDILPEELQFRHDGVTFIVIGIVLALPTLLRVVTMLRERPRSDAGPFIR